ncbi:hypothetical protein GCM10027291_18340 [Telluribacter humicola]
MITLGMLSLSWCIVYLDEISVGSYLINKVPFLRIDNASTATSLLSSLLTGLISLVTFSFSMVMIVLTQIMSSFSPRLIPDLAKQKGNQMVLGIIMGTICFITVILSNIQTMPKGPEVPLLSVVLAMFLAFSCLITFIYFIHKVSNDIQIGNIVNRIYRTTRRVLDTEHSSGNYYEQWKEEEEFITIKAWESGYFNAITQDHFMIRARKLNLKLKLLKIQGMYVLKGDPFLQINQPMNDDIMKLLEENIILRHQELVGDNFLYGFKHLTEIAVKALSPAVNDPGTAINAIDYLSDLFTRLQRLTGQKVTQSEDGAAVIVYSTIPFEWVFYLCMASIRPYSTQDVTVQSRLIDLLVKISQRDKHQAHRTLIEKELTSIESGSSKEMTSEEDIAYIRALVQNAREQMHV